MIDALQLKEINLNGCHFISQLWPELTGCTWKASKNKCNKCGTNQWHHHSLWNIKQTGTIKGILQKFGSITGQVTNFKKSSIHPIRCENIDLQNVFLSFPEACESFPCQYLGLQLHILSLQKNSCTSTNWEDRATANWLERQVFKLGRPPYFGDISSLLYADLSSHHIPSIICHSFLWKGEEKANGGHCLVNWPTVSKPKELDGLGVLDLDKFGRALWLRWLWQEWTKDDKPWIGSELPCRKEDRQLFYSSTTSMWEMSKRKFWHLSWLEGIDPRNLAPHLFQLVKRKTKTGTGTEKQ